ncbi:Calponin-1 [Tritrichomonas foetus]|uniref:Calponin-1 n=1 Tax=Tritrichomonas foetus TaxID=1144522 RepID=A0A1J4K8V4_9EUKA|nr:Calponin-1 [Tritrichomonas foetus]|eukprot:OHT07370.1 Calponin-1 [Tritrichomonas foetus]
MGIYADLQKKREGAYDVELEGRVRTWIEGNLGRKLEGPFRESLMDGTVVCELINKLKPGKIPKIHYSKILMFRRENFGFFQRACVDLGCLDNETAVFEDVYDNRNMGLFLTNIIALARNTQYQPGYNGPILQDAVKKAEAQKMNFTKEQLARGHSGPTMMEQAANQAGQAKEESRYVEHGIIANVDEHKFHGQKQ